MELNDSLSGVVAERDFYRRLLDLGAANDVEPLLDEALALIVAVTGAQVAYLELYDDERGPPRFWKGHHVAGAQVEVIQEAIEAVLCVPIGAEPVIGAIYLRGRTRPDP